MNEDVEVDLEEHDSLVRDENSENSQENIKALIHKIETKNLIPYGKVVGIVKRIQRNFCGHLITEKTKEELTQPSLSVFVPADSRYPNFYIRLRNVTIQNSN